MDLRARADYELVRASIAGCEDSFAELVERYKKLVYSIILRQVSDRDMADDYAQDVFLKMYRNLASYSPEYKLSTWLMRITGNHIVDMHRKKRPAEVPFEEERAEKAAGSARSAEGEFMRREDARRLERIFAGLPDMYKVPVALYHEQGLSYQEIADRLGEPLSKVKNRIFRGRKQLKAMLAEESGGGAL